MPADADETVVVARPTRVRRWPWVVAGVAGGAAAAGGGLAAWVALHGPVPGMAGAGPLAAPVVQAGQHALPPPRVAGPAITQPAITQYESQTGPQSRGLFGTQAGTPLATQAAGPGEGPGRPAAAAPAPVPPTPILAAAVTTSLAPSGLTLPSLATEAAILADTGPAMAAFRFAAAPDIFVLRFASLGEQADALNRIAALVERSGYPRDRILHPAELDRRIRAAGETPERVYLGHDYRSADVMRFFALAEQGQLALTPGEARLRRLAADWGWTPGTRAALVSLPREDLAAGLDPAARATILRHELSHGLYFTDPAYARYVQAFWSGTLIDIERGRFRAFLGSEGYDMQLPDLMINEMQAYLMHTTDARYFNPSVIGISARRLDALRILFLSGMPPGWLRDCTVAPAAAR